MRKLPSEGSRVIHVFVKGAPETIKRLSLPDSVPEGFHSVLGDLTQRGYRVLALGYRTLRTPWHHAERLERYRERKRETYRNLLNCVETTTV